MFCVSAYNGWMDMTTNALSGTTPSVVSLRLKYQTIKMSPPKAVLRHVLVKTLLSLVWNIQVRAKNICLETHPDVLSVHQYNAFAGMNSSMVLLHLRSLIVTWPAEGMLRASYAA